MKTLVSEFDELFGAGFVAFIRDPEKDTLTVSVTAAALSAASISPVGWNIVMGARYRVKTLQEKDWEAYLAQAIEAGSK